MSRAVSAASGRMTVPQGLYIRAYSEPCHETASVMGEALSLRELGVLSCQRSAMLAEVLCALAQLHVLACCPPSH
jgi:hypothetical protein